MEDEITLEGYLEDTYDGLMINGEYLGLLLQDIIENNKKIKITINEID